MAEILRVILKNSMKLPIIIKKELVDQFRDKRTIVAAILMPALIVPLLLFVTSQKTSPDALNDPARIIIKNNDDILKTIIYQSCKNAVFTNSDDPVKTIMNGKADLLIDALKSGNSYGTMTLYYDSTRQSSALSYLKINGILAAHFTKSSSSAHDVTILSRTIRSDKENKTLLTLSLLLPVFMMVFAASSTMSSAIDMSSGEKERSTIEILLSCNISHSTIILGKTCAASIIGFASVTSLLSGLIISSHIFPQISGGISLLRYCGYLNITIMLIITFLSVFFFSAIGMTIGLFAKSIKEGTILTLPVIVLSSALSSGLVAGDPFSINTFYLLVPVLNFSYIIRAAIYNQHEALFIIISVFANMGYASLFLLVSGRLLKKETVIFRS
jgi:sodium transport system permease protein